MKDFLVYIYCLAKKPIARFNIRGLGNKKVYQISYQDLTAVVSEVKKEEFNKKALLKNLKKPKWAEEKIRTHAEVIQEVMEKQTVLPLKFGTIFKNDEGVKKCLKANKAKFRSLLNRFEDKEEWGVKIYADRKKLAQVLGEKDREIKKLKKQVATVSPGHAYLWEKKRKEELEEKTAETVNKCVSEIFETLGRESLASRLNKNLPSKLSGKKKDMILNSVFLVDKGHFDNFSKSLNRLLKKYQQFALEGELSGPWPVYSFL